MALRVRLQNFDAPGLVDDEKRYGNGDGVLEQAEADKIATATGKAKDGLALMTKTLLPVGDEYAARTAAAKLLDTDTNPYSAGTALSRSREVDRMAIRLAAAPKRADLVQLAVGLCEAALAEGETTTAQEAAATALTAVEYAPRGAQEAVVARLRELQKRGLVLPAAVAATLDATEARLYPSKPPYDAWFQNGNKTLKAAFYFHEDYAEGFFWDLRSLGLTVTQNGSNYTVTGTLDGMPIDATARVVKSYGSDRTMLEKMNDPSINFVFYGGHSNLGGNIDAAVDYAPREMAGKKVVGLWMCKGKQKLARVSARFPDADVITTKISPPGESGGPMLRALLEGFAARKGYAEIQSKHTPTDAFLYPHNQAITSYLDRDDDGIVDGRDRWYTPGTKPKAAIARDAILFANTVLGYHTDEGTSPVKHDDVDKFDPGGFFSGPEEQVLDIKLEGGRKIVRVNERYAALAGPALQVLTVYELAKSLHATFDETAKLRCFLLAAEMLCYTTGGTEEADAALAELAKHTGLPTMTYDEVKQAIDQSSYVQAASVEKLRAIVEKKRSDS